MTNQTYFFPDEPEHYMQTLSPVSPKPVALPQPSNIPILENQMDSNMNENSNYSGTPSQTPAEFSNVQEDGYSLKPNTAVLQGLYQVQENTNGSHQKAGNASGPSETDEATHLPVEPTPEQVSDFISTFGQENEATSQGQAEVLQAAPEMPLQPDASRGMETVQDPNEQREQATDTGAVDIQALLDNIVNNATASSAPSNNAPNAASAHSPINDVAPRFPPSATLPPRPPTLNNGSNGSLPANGLSNANGQISNGAPGTGTTSSAVPSPMSPTGPPGTYPATSHLPPPPSATFQQMPPVPGTLKSPHLGLKDSADDITDDEEYERRWSVEIQKKYDDFLEQERLYVMKGEWEKFPANSRLFIGNLPTEKVTKRDLFHVFHKYGPLAQVSIKQAYGFVQFLIAQDCLRALDTEQGVSIRGRKIHLEISKPQRNRNQNQTQTNSQNQGGRDNRQRRSRSPEPRNAGGIDRYRGGANRRQRSPSPRSRNSYGRRRSRSPSPQYGSSSRTSRSDLDDDCPLPRRPPHEVPDIQIIAKDNPDRNFISYVEKTFEARGLKANVLLLSPKLPETSVMRRQIIEGVLAVAKLDRIVQMTNKFQLSVFDRSQGAQNVRFEEYIDLDLNVCVELVLRAKQIARPPMPNYGNSNTGPYGLPMTPSQQRPQFPPPNPQQPPQQYYGQAPPPQHQRPPQQSGFDPNLIQGLLSRVQQQTPQQHQQPYVAPHSGPGQQSDIARLLASASQTPGQQQQQPYGQPSSLPPNLQALLGNVQQHQQQPPQSYQQYQQSPPQQQPSQPYQQQQQQQQQQPPDMKNIMAGLARWKGLNGSSLRSAL